MIVKLHKNARTTPAIRTQLAASNESVAVLAKRSTWRQTLSANGRLEPTSTTALIPLITYKLPSTPHKSTSSYICVSICCYH